MKKAYNNPEKIAYKLFEGTNFREIFTFEKISKKISTRK